MGCDIVALRFYVEKLQNLQFCSFAAKMCKSTAHFSVESNISCSNRISQMPVNAISSNERRAQLKHQAKQKQKTKTRSLFCDGARGRETDEL